MMRESKERLSAGSLFDEGDDRRGDVKDEDREDLVDFFSSPIFSKIDMSDMSN
jgi:hypothetical protein